MDWHMKLLHQFHFVCYWHLRKLALRNRLIVRLSHKCVWATKCRPFKTKLPEGLLLRKVRNIFSPLVIACWSQFIINYFGLAVDPLRLFLFLLQCIMIFFILIRVFKKLKPLVAVRTDIHEQNNHNDIWL